jgi:hypothetical protein
VGPTCQYLTCARANETGQVAHAARAGGRVDWAKLGRGGGENGPGRGSLAYFPFFFSFLFLLFPFSFSHPLFNLNPSIVLTLQGITVQVIKSQHEARFIHIIIYYMGLSIKGVLSIWSSYT